MSWSELFQNVKSTKGSVALPIDELILEDHKPLKEFIKVMKDLDEDFERRKNVAEEFAIHLIAHAKPEEEVLYEQMKMKDDLRIDAFEASTEHELADQVVENIKREQDKDALSAMIKVVAELVEHHIEEEESTVLPEVSKAFSSSELKEMGARFLQKKEKLLEMGGDDSPHEAGLDIH